VSAQDSGEERLPYIFPAGDADRTEDERWWVENATDVCRYAGRTLGRNYDAAFSGGAGAAAVAPVISPFLYNVGIDYETFNTTDIPADLTAVTKNFALIRTYHDAAVGTIDPNKPQIDPGEQQVISYVTSHTNGSHPIQLIMGTNNNALAQGGGSGHPWSAGLMTTRTYTALLPAV
jgi:hypothetical protein